MSYMLSKRKIKRLLIVCALIILICSFASSYIKTSFGQSTTSDLRIENNYGSTICMTMYKPMHASSFNYVPAIFLIAGENDDKDDLTSLSIELSRRGFAVITVNESGQGGSIAVDEDSNPHFIYDAIKYVSDLSYIDSSKIGIVGYTNNAAKKINEVIELDEINKNQLVSCVLFIAGDAVYKNNEGEFFNYYGSRHVGIISVKYDDLSHIILSEDGKKVEKFSPEFVFGIDALSFTSFGRNPGTLVSGVGDNLNHILWFGSQGVGTGSSRAVFLEKTYRAYIYNNINITKYACEFLTESFNIKSDIDAKSQIWIYKYTSDFISLISFFVFIITLVIGLCRTGLFCDTSLLNESNGEFQAEPVGVIGKKNHSFTFLITYFVFATLSYFKMASFSNLEFIGQKQSAAISFWLFGCGIFLSIVSMLWYYLFAKRNEFNAVRLGLKVPKIVIFKTLSVVFLSVLAGCFILVVIEYFFNVDLRVGSFALRTMSLDRLIYSFIPLLFFNMVYFIPMSIFQNTVLYNTQSKKYNTIWVAIFTSLPVFIIPAVQIVSFIYLKKPFFFSLDVPYGDYVAWLVPIQFAFIIASILSRYIFRRTKNIYLPALINAVWFTAMIVANTKMV